MDTFEHKPLVVTGATYFLFPLLILFKIVEKRCGINGTFYKRTNSKDEKTGSVFSSMKRFQSISFLLPAYQFSRAIYYFSSEKLCHCTENEILLDP